MLPFPVLLRSIWESGQEEAGLSKRDIQEALSGCQLPQGLQTQAGKGLKVAYLSVRTAAALSYIMPSLRAPEPLVSPNVRSSHACAKCNDPTQDLLEP